MRKNQTRKNRKLTRAFVGVKPVLPAIALAAMSTTASATLLIYEPFNYSTAQPLLGLTNTSAGTTASGNSWLRASSSATTTAINIDSTAGSLTGPAELPASIGNELKLTGNGNNSGGANRLAFNSTISTGSVYYSFLMRVDDLNVAQSNNSLGAFFMSLNNTGNSATTNNPTTVPGKIQARIDPTDATKFNLGNFTNRALAAVPDATSAAWSSALNVGQTYLVVGQYTVAASNTARLWIDPNPSSFGLATAPATTLQDSTSGTNANILSLVLRQSALPFMTIDELRVATTWGEVTPTLSAYWDLNGATAGAGATPTGTWDGVTSNWSASALGDVATSVWPGTAYKAVFSAGTDATGSYTVTVSGTQNASALSFEEGSATLTGGTVNLSSGVLEAATGVTATIQSGISGSSGLSKNSAGTVVVSGSMSYTGTTTINGGTLQVGEGGTAGALPTGSAITNNGTLAFNQSDTVTQGTDFSSSGMSGTGGLTQAGAGNLILNVPNTFTGITKATAGTITVTDSLGLQNSTVDTTGAGSIVFDNALTSASVGGLQGGTAYTANSAMSITVGNNVRDASYSAAITGTGSLTKVGSSAQQLTAVNTYSGGTNINAGILQFGPTNSMPATGAVAVNSGGTLSVHVSGAGEWTNGTSGVGTLGGLISGDGGQTASQVTWNSGSALGINTDLGESVTYAGSIGSFNGVSDATKSVGLIKRGQGGLTLTGTNTFRGQFQVANDGGVVRLSSALTGAGQSMAIPTVNLGNAGGDATFTDGSRDTGVKILVNDALPTNSLVFFGSSVAGTNAPSSLLQLYDGFAPNGSNPSGASFNQTIRGLTGGAGRAKLGMGTLTIDVPDTETYSNSSVLRTDYQDATVHGRIIKTGLGRQDLGGGNADFNGDFILQQGTLGVAAANVFGVSGSLTNRLILNGGTLRNATGTGLTIAVKRVEFGGSFTVDPVTASNMQFQDATFTLTTANPTITVLPGAGGQFIAWGKITDNGAGYGFTKAGAGTLNLTASGIAGANDYTGDTTIQAGALRVIEFSQIGDAFGSSDVNLSGGTLEFNGSGIANGRLFNVINPVHVTADSRIAYNSTTAGLTDVAEPNGVVFEFSNSTFDRTGGTLTFQHLATSQGITFRPRFSSSGFDFTGPVVISNGGGSRKTVLESTNSTGTQTWSGNISGDGGYHRTGGGTTLLGGANTYTGPTTINGGSTLNVQRSLQGTASINVTNGLLNILPQANPYDVSSEAGTNKTTTVSVPAAGKIDLSNTKLITQDASMVSTPVYDGINDIYIYDGIHGLVQKGRGDGTWNGTTGITTSQTEATTGILTSLAVGTGAELRGLAPTQTELFAGQTINGNSTVVMYTYGGDADMDGDLDGDDYFYLDSNVLQSETVFGWHQGDFNYDGRLNGDDYFILDSNILQAQSSGNVFWVRPPEFAGSGGLAAVPEPASLGVLALGAGLMMRRRRR